MSTELVLFGPAHLASLAAVFAAALAVPWATRRLSPEAVRRWCVGTAAALAGYRLLQIPVRHLWLGEPLRETLPFHLCGLLFFIIAWMLWRESFRAFEIAWFWGIGSIVALFAPEVDHGFPHPEYLLFFLSHGMILVSVAFAVRVLGFRPTFRSAVKAWLAVNLWGLVVTPVNLLLDTNYMYLRSKPEATTILELMGPYPWYMVTGEVLAFLAAVVLWLPFPVADTWRRARERERLAPAVPAELEGE